MIVAAQRLSGTTVDRLEVGAYRIPTDDGPESDGTLEWSATTMVVVHVYAGDTWGMGYTYAPPATAKLIQDELSDIVTGRDAMAVAASWELMCRSLRNAGVTGIGAMAVSAVDCALWDLKARLLELPLVTLLGAVRSGVPVYGSGGFTSYDHRRLASQLRAWVDRGIPRVKMKVGRDAGEDIKRVQLVRKAIGDDAELFVDANGGYERKQAVAMAHIFGNEFGVTWMEEPRPMADREGLRFVKDHAPAGLEVAAGEYGYQAGDFRLLLEDQAVDCLQADVTRCLGVTGFLKVGALCDAFHVPLSAHCAPAASIHVCCAVRPIRHIEYFYDHVRIEHMLFDGAESPRDGILYPNRDRHGFGIQLKWADAEQYAV